MISSKSYEDFTPDLSFRSTTNGQNSDTEDEVDMDADDCCMAGTSRVDGDPAYSKGLSGQARGNGQEASDMGHSSKVYRSNSRSLKPEGEQITQGNKHR